MASKFQIDVVTDVNGAVTGIKTVDTQFGTLRTKAQQSGAALASSLGIPEAKLKSFGDSLAKVGAGMTVAGGVISAGFAVATAGAAQFEYGLTNVLNLLGNEGKKYSAEFAQGISDAATKTGQSTESLTKSLFDIVSAGTDASKAVDLLAVSADLAQAGMTTTDVTTSALLTTMKAFGGEMRNAGDASDYLFSIQKFGRTTLEEVASSFGKVAPLAAQAGLSANDLGAALSTATLSGTSTAEVVTSLQQLLKTFITPTEGAAKAAKEMGFELNANSLKGDNFAKTLGLISKGTIEQQTAVAGSIEAFRALAPIVADVSKFEEIRVGILDREGAAEKAAAEIRKTSVASYNALKETVLELTRAIGDNLLPVATNFANQVQPIIKSITEWIRNNDELAGRITVAVATMGGLLTVIGTISVAVGGAVSAIAPLLTAVGAESGLAGVFTLATGPIGLTVAAIAAFITIAVTFRKELYEAAVGVTAFVMEFINGIPHIDKIAAVLKAFGQLVLLTIELILTPFVEIFKAIGRVAGDFFDVLRSKGRESMAAYEAQTKAAAAAQEGMGKGAFEVKGAAREMLDQIEKTDKGVDDHGSTLTKTTEKVKKFKDEIKTAGDALDEQVQKLKDAEAAVKRYGDNLDYLANRDMKAALDATKDIKQGLDDTVGSFQRFDDVGNDALESIRQTTEKLTPKLSEVPKRTHEIEDAFKTLKTKSVSELTALATEADKQFALIKSTGTASAEQLLEAEVNALQAHKAAAMAAGGDINREEQRRLDELLRIQGGHHTESTSLFTKWSDGVVSIVNSLGADLTTGLFGGGFNKDKIGEKLRSIADSFKTSFFDPVSKLIGGFINGGLKTLTQGLTGLASGQGLSGFGGLAGNIAGALGGKSGGGLGSAIGGLFGIGGGVAGALGGGGAAGASALSAGAASSGFLTIGGGAGAAAGGGGILGGLGGGIAALATNPIGIAILGSLGAAVFAKKIFSKDTIEKFKGEFARDFGNVDLPKDFIGGLLNTLDITKKQLDPIRKDIASAPITLVAALEKARQQGKEQAFLTSLESVGNVFGKGNLREGLEFGQLTGDFSALNQAFTDLFQQSTALTGTFGNDLKPLLIDMAANGVTPLTAKILELQEAGRTQTEIFQELGGEIGLQIATASQLGLTLDPLITQFNDMAAEVEGLTDRQASLLTSFNDLQAAPERLSEAMTTLAGDIEFLQEKGASNEQIMSLMGDSLRGAAEAAVELGVAIPPLIAQMLGLDGATDGLNASQVSLLANLQALKDAPLRTAESMQTLVGDIDLLREHGATTEQIMTLLGDKLRSTADAAVQLGVEIPAVIQQLLGLQGAVDGVGGAADRLSAGRQTSVRGPQAPGSADQQAAIAGLQARLGNIDPLAIQGALGGNPFASLRTGGLTGADIRAIQSGQLPDAGGNTARFGEFQQIIVDTAAAAAAMRDSTSELRRTTPRPGYSGPEASFPAEQTTNANVTLQQTVNVTTEGLNEDQVGTIVESKMAEQGDRFIRNSLIPAINDAVRNNTGGLRTRITRA